MGLAWACLPRGAEKEGSRGESVVLTQAQSQPLWGSFWETSGVFCINFQVSVAFGCLAEWNDALGLRSCKKRWICGSVLGVTGFSKQSYTRCVWVWVTHTSEAARGKSVRKVTLQKWGCPSSNPCLSALGGKPFWAAGVVMDPKVGCGGVSMVGL